MVASLEGIAPKSDVMVMEFSLGCNESIKPSTDSQCPTDKNTVNILKTTHLSLPVFSPLSSLFTQPSLGPLSPGFRGPCSRIFVLQKIQTLSLKCMMSLSLSHYLVSFPLSV